MGFNRDVIRRRRDQMHEWGVRVRWAGRRPRLWRSVITELEAAEQLTRHNDVLTLTMCVNYGGRAEIADAARAIAREAAAGRLDPERVDERTVARFLDEPDLPDVDMFLRTSGEQRTSNFMLWQAAYAELVFLDVLWPDVDRRVLWRAIEEYAARDRRYGGAVDSAGATAPPGSARLAISRRSQLDHGWSGWSRRAGAGGAGAEHLDHVLDVGEAVLLGDPAGPALHREAVHLDRCAGSGGRSGGGDARCCTAGTPTRRPSCAGRRQHRQRRAAAASGTPWPSPPCRPVAAACRATAGR